MNREAYYQVLKYITNSISIIGLVEICNLLQFFQATQEIGMINTVLGAGFIRNIDISLE